MMNVIPETRRAY